MTTHDELTDTSNLNFSLNLTDSTDKKKPQWNGSLITLSAFLSDFKQFIRKNSALWQLIHTGAISLNNGKTAIYSADQIQLLENISDDTDKPTYESPFYPAKKTKSITTKTPTIEGTPSKVTTKTPEGTTDQYTVAPVLIDKFDLDLLNIIISCYSNETMRDEDFETAENSGRKLLEILHEKSKKLRPEHINLLNTKLQMIASSGIKGKITRSNFDAFKAEYDKTLHAIPEGLRPFNVAIATHLKNAIGKTDDNVAARLDFELKIERADPSDLKDYVDKLRAFIDTEELRDELNVQNNSVQGLLAHGRDPKKYDAPKKAYDTPFVWKPAYGPCKHCGGDHLHRDCLTLKENQTTTSKPEVKPTANMAHLTPTDDTKILDILNNPVYINSPKDYDTIML